MRQLYKRIITLTLLVSVAVSSIAQEKVTYIHHDGLGNPVVGTDENGDIEWQIEHYPYGAEYSNTEVRRKSDIGFAGKAYDEEIGLSYFGGRWYDPDLGRFVSIDPVGVNAEDWRTFNRYSYGFNNPYKYIDPDGNLPFLIPVAIFLAKEGAAEVASRATGGATDFLSFRRLGQKGLKAGIKAAKGNATNGGGRSGKQARLREIMNDPKASSADRGWLKNDARHVKTGNKSGLRLPRNGRKSPGRKAQDKGYELAHPHTKPASQGHGYAGSKLKNHADHKVETRLHRKRY